MSGIRNVELMRIMLNSILDFAKIENNKSLILNKDSFDLIQEV
jgi:hypothetical protein